MSEKTNVPKPIKVPTPPRLIIKDSVDIPKGTFKPPTPPVRK